MAIEITGTVQVKDLPPNALSLTDLIPHEVGDVLSKCTLQELVNFIQVRVTARQYEVKFIRAPNPAYITDNFNMASGATQGIGKVGGLWEGWAICNGNNGTDNDDGQTYIGYGANYPTVGNFVGEKTHTLTIPEMPVHNFLNGVANGQASLFVYGSSTQDLPGLATAGIDEFIEPRKFQGKTNSLGEGLPHNNLQPSKVMLKIMKL